MRNILTLLTLFCIGFGWREPALAQLTINGRLLGSGGNSMKLAQVVVEGPHDFSIRKVTDEQGNFTLELEQRGGYHLYLMGVHHAPLEFPIIVDKRASVDLEAQLMPFPFASQVDSARVIGDFNGFSDDDGGFPMERQPDGTFAAVIPVHADTLGYQIVGPEETWWGAIPISGTHAHRYVSKTNRAPWSRGGQFVSVLDVSGGQAEIGFDPGNLPRSDEEPTLRISDLTLDGIAHIFLDVEERERASGLARVDGKDYDWSHDQNHYKRRIEKEDDPLLRQWMLLRYFDELHPTEGDSLLARVLLREVPPDSPFWSYEARSAVGASNIIFMVGRTANAPDLVEGYVDRLIANHYDPSTRAQLVYAGFHLSEESEKEHYYRQLESDFADTRQYENVRRTYDPDRAIQSGRPIPDFSFVSLGDSSVVHSAESLSGKTYLIDFWGTWCAPCIAEMPYLHEAYAEFHGEGFEILSVAFMDTREAIESFRRDRYPMPWLHTLVTSDEDQAVREKFELVGFPRPVLMDDSGTIIATDEELRGEKLLSVLNETLRDSE